MKTKKILIQNWNGVLNDLESELILRGHTILANDGNQDNFKKADLILTWCEMENGGWREVVRRAHKYKKKVILFQHGRRAVSRIYPPFNEQLESDLVCVWGENDKKRIMKVGVPEKKIRIIGCPLFKHLKPRVGHKEINVVFSPDHWEQDIEENLIIADELRKLKGVNIITKTLKGVQNDDLYDNPVSSDRQSPDHMSIVADVLSRADVVVSLSDATFELLAESLDIPVVSVDFWIPRSAGGDDKYKEYKKPFSTATTVVKNIKDLNKAIYFAIENPDHLHDERIKEVIGDGGLENGGVVYDVISLIENI